MPTAEFFLTSFLQRTQKDGFPCPFFFDISPSLVHKLLNFAYNRPPAPEPVVVCSSLEEDEALSSLLRRYLHFSGLTSFLEPLIASILTWAARHRPRPSAGETSVPNCQDATLESSGRDSGWCLFSSSPNSFFGPLLSSGVPAYEEGYVSARGFSSSPKEDGVSPCKSSGLTVSEEVREDTPSSSSAARNYAELISSLSAQGDKVRSFPLPPFHTLSNSFGLPIVFWPSCSGSSVYKELLSSYEAASEPSSQAGRLERELEALKKEKAREEGVLQRRVRNLASEHSTLQEKYADGARCLEAVRAELEGTRAERDFALKKGDHLHAGRDEMIQTHTCWTN
ncbi:hypothetical protein LIER_38074 [Lithospermum erythrorhizon]|uniref:Uncharacterized protein n=1 Tax=Lithospermum erythrorhizon TaxID=34254 RepID=A0AAV3PVW0_LITER